MRVDRHSDACRDRRAVAPVIAVVLMLALTVLMAAAAVPFVLSQSDQVDEQRPDVDIAFAYTEDVDTNNDDLGTDWSDEMNGTLTVVFESGESVPASQLNISGAESSGNIGLSDGEFDEDDDITAGTHVSVFVSRGDTVQVIWQSSDGEKSSILADFTIRPTE